jgi:hypothetical protein
VDLEAIDINDVAVAKTEVEEETGARNEPREKRSRCGYR